MRTQTEQINPGDVVRVIKTGRLVRVNEVRDFMSLVISGENYRFFFAGSYKSPVIYSEDEIEKVDDPTTADVPLVRGGQGRDDWDMEGRGPANPVGLALAVLFVGALALAVALILPSAQDGDGLTPCDFCGYPFDVDALGPYGCPNCHGEGLEDVEG